MSSSRPSARDPRPLRRVRASVRTGFVWGVAAAAANSIIFVVADLAGVPFSVWPGRQTASVQLSVLTVIAATLVAAILAGLLTGLAAKQIRRPIPWIVGAGILVTVASLSAPLGQPASVPIATRVMLIAMHGITAVLVICGLAIGLRTDDRKK